MYGKVEIQKKEKCVGKLKKKKGRGTESIALYMQTVQECCQKEDKCLF